jgi:hypothetical protein
VANYTNIQWCNAVFPAQWNRQDLECKALQVGNTTGKMRCHGVANQ